MKHMLRIEHSLPLLLVLALALAVQPAEAQELRTTLHLGVDQDHERVIPDATMAAERFVDITMDRDAEAVSQSADRPLAGTPGSAPAGAWNGRGQEPLFDNGPLVNCEGCTNGFDVSRVQITTLGMTIWGVNVSVTDEDYYRIADNFTVPDGATWHIDELWVFGYQTGSDETSTFTHVNVRIWDGFPDAPGSNLVFGDVDTNRLLKTEWAEIYRDNENEPGNTQRPVMVQSVDIDFEIESGDYYIDWQMDGDLGSGPWQPFVTINGVCETGNAWQLTAEGWRELRDGPDECWQGVPFLLFGEEKVVSTEGNPDGLTLALEAVHPNPVAGLATLNFTLPTAADVNLGVYDLLGRRVAVAADGEFGAGAHSVGFDSTGLAAGIYVVRLSAGNEIATRRLTVVR